MNLPKGHLSKEDCITLVNKIGAFGFKKINFAGGEPTLCPWLHDLIAEAKAQGMVTSIVTNGSQLTEKWLDDLNGTLDWIGLSIDSVTPENLKRSGRVIGGNTPITASAYLNIIEAIKKRNIRLKINTVVTSVNWEEDFTPFLTLAAPERWKILQVLPIRGQNDASIGNFVITKTQFEAYVKRNRIVERQGICIVAENHEMLTGSYAMIDPAGRFFDNLQGAYNYSPPILDVGITKALKHVSMDIGRFYQRGGKYNY